MRRPIAAACAALLIAAAGVNAQEAGVKFDAANNLYREGKYRQAAETYESIVSNGYESAPLYYNLGNAWYKAENWPAAILSYERARRLAPGDEDILHNLRLANLRIVDRIEPIPRLFFVEWWDDLVSQASSSQWGIAGIAALWAAALLLGLWRVVRKPAAARTLVVAASAAAAFAIFAFTAGHIRNREERSDDWAILFAPTISVKSAPDEKSTDLFVLHEGVRVRLLDSVGLWRKIALADGKIGWLPAVDLRVI